MLPGSGVKGCNVQLMVAYQVTSGCAVSLRYLLEKPDMRLGTRQTLPVNQAARSTANSVTTRGRCVWNRGNAGMRYLSIEWRLLISGISMVNHIIQANDRLKGTIR